MSDGLARAVEIARDYITSRESRPVFPTASLDDLRAALGGALPDDPIDPAAVVDGLARAADPGLVTTTGPRYFGFVTGGALPAAVAAEWLVTAWDQNAGLNVMSPAAADPVSNAHDANRPMTVAAPFTSLRRPSLQVARRRLRRLRA